MAIDNDTSFGSRSEMEAVSRKYNRNAKVAGLCGAGTVVGLIMLDLPMAILYDRTPITQFLQTHYWESVLGIILVLMLLDRTEFFEREVKAVGRANLIVRNYKRGASDIEKGMKAGSTKLVTRGLERLEQVASACSGVAEYQELVTTGRSWLRAHEKREPSE